MNIKPSSDNREFSAFSELQEMTNEQLEEIYLRGDNLHISTSRASAAKRLLDIRRARMAEVPKDPVQQQITIGNLYGQFAGVNNGTMVQNNNQDVLESLDALTKITAESDLEDAVKQDVLGDIQTVQAQITKKSPNRQIMEAAFVGIQVLANLAQIASVAVIPHLDKIQHFIGQIKLS